MDARKRSASIGAVLVAALATRSHPRARRTTTTRWVDGDGRAGPNGCNSSASAYKKIQKAVNASNDDDTVIVCPGTYRQQVRIRGDRDGLTLKSSTPFGATLLTPSSPSEVDGGVFMISVEEVDGVTVRGFKVLARTDGPCDDLDVGDPGDGFQGRGGPRQPRAGARYRRSWLVVRDGRRHRRRRRGVQRRGVTQRQRAGRVQRGPRRRIRWHRRPRAVAQGHDERRPQLGAGLLPARAHPYSPSRASAAASSVSRSWAMSGARSGTTWSRVRRRHRWTDPDGCTASWSGTRSS